MELSREQIDSARETYAQYKEAEETLRARDNRVRQLIEQVLAYAGARGTAAESFDSGDSVHLAECEFTEMVNLAVSLSQDPTEWLSIDQH